jgi:hypothetical protein
MKKGKEEYQEGQGDGNLKVFDENIPVVGVCVVSTGNANPAIMLGELLMKTSLAVEVEFRLP